jgi:hypothetical protein
MVQISCFVVCCCVDLERNKKSLISIIVEALWPCIYKAGLQAMHLTQNYNPRRIAPMRDPSCTAPGILISPPPSHMLQPHPLWLYQPLVFHTASHRHSYPYPQNFFDCRQCIARDNSDPLTLSAAATTIDNHPSPPRRTVRSHLALCHHLGNPHHRPPPPPTAPSSWCSALAHSALSTQN